MIEGYGIFRYLCGNGPITSVVKSILFFGGKRVTMLPQKWWQKL